MKIIQADIRKTYSRTDQRYILILQRRQLVEPSVGDLKQKFLVVSPYGITHSDRFRVWTRPLYFPSAVDEAEWILESQKEVEEVYLIAENDLHG